MSFVIGGALLLFYIDNNQMKAIDDFLEDKIKNTYIVIDPMYRECPFAREIWHTKF